MTSSEQPKSIKGKLGELKEISDRIKESQKIIDEEKKKIMDMRGEILGSLDKESVGEC